jgi:hypothetical protein
MILENVSLLPEGRVIPELQFGLPQRNRELFSRFIGNTICGPTALYNGISFLRGDVDLAEYRQLVLNYLTFSRFNSNCVVYTRRVKVDETVVTLNLGYAPAWNLIQQQEVEADIRRLGVISFHKRRVVGKTEGRFGWTLTGGFDFRSVPVFLDHFYPGQFSWEYTEQKTLGIEEDSAIQLFKDRLATLKLGEEFMICSVRYTAPNGVHSSHIVTIVGYSEDKLVVIDSNHRKHCLEVISLDNFLLKLNTGGAGIRFGVVCKVKQA